MINLSIAKLAEILELNEFPDTLNFEGVSIDTRTLKPGNLFIAIPGNRVDGHNYIQEAAKKGAAAAIVMHATENALTQLIVKDSILALGKIASYWRSQFNLPIIAVTGSNGKTTLKNMLASILTAACGNDSNKVLATQGNFNNDIGLPLNLVRLSSKHRYAVLEMGMNHFGEIAYLTKLAKPTIAVINNAAEAHLEGLETVAGVAKAKGEIFQGLDPKGIAILNADDNFYNYWKELIGNISHLTFGFDKADITAEIPSESQKIKILTPKGNFDIQLPLLGKHNIQNALAATAAALAAGINLTAIQTGLENVKPANGRMQLHPLPNNVTVIDDTYNANPFSVEAAINTLAAFPNKKVLILGDMKELGPEAQDYHAKIGLKASTAGIDCLLTFGELSKAASDSFTGQSQHFTDQDKLTNVLKTHMTPHSTILIKGSRSMQMEKILAKILPSFEHTH